jgi:chorismate synthase
LTTSDAQRSLTAGALGFIATAAASQCGETVAWSKQIRGRTFYFRLLRTLDELKPAEAIQRTVFGVSDRDLMPANALIGAYETGGDVIGVFTAENGEERFAGHLVSLGGYYRGRPRIVSDFMVLYPEYRSFGLGAELKKLQAAMALERGFTEIVWTVDPLRGANARLNIEKLGATANQYEINRYGDDYGEGIYGGMPTDRLHMIWDISSPAVAERLLGRIPPLTLLDIMEAPRYESGCREARVLVHIPGDIDSLLQSDPDEALYWRLSLRNSLADAFASGYTITGFVNGAHPYGGFSSYLLTRPVSPPNGSE